LSVQICNNLRVTFALLARQIKKMLDDPLYLQLKLKPYVYEILERLIFQSKFQQIDSFRVNQTSLESTVATVLQLNVETASLLASLELDLTLSDPVRSFLIFIFVNIVTVIGNTSSFIFIFCLALFRETKSGTISIWKS